jgi:Putative prokaryotic signal transducing protein
MSEDLLICPGCASRAPDSERFCPACGLPLIYDNDVRAAQPPLSRSQERARKVKPQYSEGALVRVLRAPNQTEAEFVQGLLLEEGIPSMLRGEISGYAPVIGGQDVLVPQSGVQAAREVLSWKEGP